MFYLLDAISKNVFDRYAGGFSPIVSHLFLDSYHEVDQRKKLKSNTSECRGLMDACAPLWRGDMFVFAVPSILPSAVLGGASSHTNVRHRQD